MGSSKMTNDMTVIRGSSIAIDQHGILLRGDSGVGKSDLALRLIDGGATLISDDYTVVENRQGHLFASAPEAIQGLFEVRGLGVLQWSETTTARLVAIFDLVPKLTVDRLPEPNVTDILGFMIPCFRLAPCEPSAPNKIRLALALASGSLKRLP